MSTLKLVPLYQIPYAARKTERKARSDYFNRYEASQAAQYEIVQAEGTYSGAYPPSVGWVCTKAAAEAISGRVVDMPGGTCHHDLAYVFRG